jgi:serine/threonine-protein kinase
MPFVVGEQVGAYRIVEQLGQGGMSTVYKAYHAALDRYVALKVLHPVFKGDREFLARFQREARIVARLEHPRIVPVYDFSEHEGTPYLVMRFVEGRTLKAVLAAESPLPYARIVEILCPVAEALEYAHGLGVLHRDIKPSNVLLTRDGKVYVTDFGLAKMVQSGDASISQDRMIGTPQYISPEQAKGETLDQRTDLYSLGVILFEMVTGRVPFVADTPFAVVHDHIFSPLPLPSKVNPAVPPALEQVILKALAKAPADRYQAAGELVGALGAVVGSLCEPVSPGPVQPPTATPEQTGAPPSTVTIPSAAAVSTPAGAAAALPPAPAGPAAQAEAPSTIELPAPYAAAAGLAAEAPAATAESRPSLEQPSPPAARAEAAAPRKQRAYRWLLWVLGGLVLVVLLLFVGGPIIRQRRARLATATALAVAPTPPAAAAFPLRPGDLFPRDGLLMTPAEAGQRLRELAPLLTENPRDPGLHMERGNALYDREEWDAAAEAYRQAMALEPELAPAHYNLGLVYVHLGAPEKAVTEFERALGLRPGFEQQLLFNLGVSYALVGRPDEARKTLDRFLQLHREIDIWRRRAEDVLRYLERPQ